jgi:bifunctional enzyme CysN/CysC
MERMNIVIVGHVDHGKSTLIGRLLADTGSLPQGKLEQVKAMCEINAKPFEYAFLLDALKDEQSQGITIDTARSFFKTDKRHYIIIDAPGHIEFLKNMITGAARAEAAMLLIDAHEGVKENSRRHGYLLSLLGIKQIVVLVNKMDIVRYDEKVYNAIVDEYSQFLSEIHVTPKAFVPIAAREGDNLIQNSQNTPWYTGKPVLSLMDSFEKEKEKDEQALRFPIQDIYKFTEENDDRRIIAGTIETGTVRVGDDVIFYPSKKTSSIKKIEGFNTSERTEIGTGYATGFTLKEEIYIKPGEIMCKASEQAPEVGTTFKANLFWLGKAPMIPGKKYMIKLATARTTVYLHEIISVLDAAELTSSTQKKQIDRHDVSECILQTLRPLAFDTIQNLETTGRFVIIDDYEIAGGGIITENLSHHISRVEHDVQARNYAWTRSKLWPQDRADKFNQKPVWVIITGEKNTQKFGLARELEKQLFESGKNVYWMGISNITLNDEETRDEHLQRLGEMAHLFTDAGILLISTISELDDDDVTLLKTLCKPQEVIVITIEDTTLSEENKTLSLSKELTQQERLDKIITTLKQTQNII